MRVTTFLLVLLLPAFLRAQDVDDNRVVGIVSFNANNAQDSLAAKSIYATVSRTLIQTKRFTVLEINEWKKTQEEIDRQKDQAFLEQPIIEKGKSLGAQILAIGIIKNADVQREPGNTSARVDYELKFINVQTGKSIAAATFKGSSGNIAKGAKIISKLPLSSIMGRGSETARMAQSGLKATQETDKTTPEGRLMDAIESTAGPLNSWIRNTFNFSLYFLKVVDEDRKGVQSVLVEGGEDINMKVGTKLKMVLITEAETARGKIRDEEPLADLEVEEVRAQTSKCKVVTGQKKIMEHAQSKNLRVVYQ